MLTTRHAPSSIASPRRARLVIVSSRPIGVRSRVARRAWSSSASGASGCSMHARSNASSACEVIGVGRACSCRWRRPGASTSARPRRAPRRRRRRRGRARSSASCCGSPRRRSRGAVAGRVVESSAAARSRRRRRRACGAAEIRRPAARLRRGAARRARAPMSAALRRVVPAHGVEARAREQPRDRARRGARGERCRCVSGAYVGVTSARALAPTLGVVGDDAHEQRVLHRGRARRGAERLRSAAAGRGATRRRGRRRTRGRERKRE